VPTEPGALLEVVVVAVVVVALLVPQMQALLAELAGSMAAGAGGTAIRKINSLTDAATHLFGLFGPVRHDHSPQQIQVICNGRTFYSDQRWSAVSTPNIW